MNVIIPCKVTLKMLKSVCIVDEMYIVTVTLIIIILSIKVMHEKKSKKKYEMVIDNIRLNSSFSTCRAIINS